MRVFLIAGEASGDKLGAALMAGLNDLTADVEYHGVGGAQMRARGLSSLFDYTELSVMGLVEVLPKYRALKRRIRETAAAVIAAKPDVLITIDSPDFCLRVARLVKAASGIRTVHYVVPSVWAWRPGRAAKMAPTIDQVLALLPFEPPYMQDVGMRCDFVGHPIVAEPAVTDPERAAFNNIYGTPDGPRIVVLPGSRRGEVSRLGPVFGDALRAVAQQNPDCQLIVPAAAPVADAVLQMSKSWPGAPIVLDPRGLSADEAETRKRIALAVSDIALAASGTVSLELAAAATPVVVGYNLNWLSWQVISRMAIIDTVSLVNLVTDSRVIPEFLGPDCRAGPIADALSALINDPAAQQVQRDAMAATMQALGQGGEAPGLRAARAVLDGLQGDG